MCMPVEEPMWFTVARVVATVVVWILVAEATR